MQIQRNEMIRMVSAYGTLPVLWFLFLTFSSPLAGTRLACASQSEPPSTSNAGAESLGILSRFEIIPVDTLGPDPSLSDYLGYAAVHNEELKSAYLAWKALENRAPQATALPDPVFRYTLYLEPVETRVGPQEHAFALAQTIPWFGELSLKGQVEEEHASAAAANVDAAFLKVAYQVRKAYFDLAYLGHAIAITQEHLDLLAQWEAVARSRYETGIGGYADVIKAQVELGKLADRLAELRDRYRPLAAALNAALNRPPDTLVPWPNLPTGAMPPIDEIELMGRLSNENPDLNSLHHQAESFLQAEKLASKQGYPELTLGINYIQTGQARMAGVPDSGHDAVMANLAINIPLWRGKYSAAKKEAAGKYRAVHSARADRENTLMAELERALFSYRDSLRKMDLYGDTLLPKGRQSLGATVAAYESGKAGFLDVIDAERLLLEFELSHARAAADLRIHLAEIEKLVGGPVATGLNELRERSSDH